MSKKTTEYESIPGMPKNLTPEQLQEMKRMGEAIKKQGKADQQKKIKCFAQLNRAAKDGGILFTGSSLMEQFPICELCMDAGITVPVYNRGVGGFTTEDFLENIHVQLLDLKPAKVFINIGTNDMNPQYGDAWMEHLLSNYRQILKQCQEQLPNTEVYLMAYYPVNDHMPERPFYMSFMFAVRSNSNIAKVNREMEKMASEFGYHFINVNEGLTDENGDLKEAYTMEGIHMYPDAYMQVFSNLKPYI